MKYLIYKILIRIPILERYARFSNRLGVLKDVRDLGCIEIDKLVLDYFPRIGTTKPPYNSSRRIRVLSSKIQFDQNIFKYEFSDKEERMWVI